MQSVAPSSCYTQKIRVFSRTDVGKRRQRNEDALGVIARHGIYVVADGMGGVDGGDFASRQVVNDLVETFQEISPDSLTFSERLDRISETINVASASIRREADARGITGMGTTFVAFCVNLDDPSEGCALHVGDSRVYRFRHQTLVTLTQDHSLAAESGLEESEAIPMFMAGVITRAVGIKDRVEVERTPLELQPGDSYMLCSDGLYNMVGAPQMTSILNANPEDPSAEFVRLANNAGGYDNITVIVLQLPGDPQPAGLMAETQS